MVVDSSITFSIILGKVDRSVSMKANIGGKVEAVGSGGEENELWLRGA